MDKNQRPSRKRAKKTPEEIAKIEAEYKQLIRKSIKEGKNIVVIDNGDPTIYGPHIYFVKEFQDLAPKIIPGISSFNAANAALQTSVIGGLEDAKGVTLTVGSTKNAIIDKLAPTQSTMVFFMDREFDKFITHLLTLYPKETPIAIVINAGESQKEEVIVATLATIQAKVGKEKIPFNHLVYVGNFL
jgi:Precorrin-4 methylase